MVEEKINNCELIKLKENYEIIKNKYFLPDFKFLNENFEIELISSDETELLTKRIRKQIMEKVSAGLRALEMFLNPQSAPVFIFSVIKSFSSNDKQIIEDLYEKFAEFEIEAFGLENSYAEEKEIEFIKRICKEWSEISKDFERIYNSMKANYKKESKKNDKSYLG